MNLDRVTQYAVDVVEGKIIAGRPAILACKRHLDDLEKSKLNAYKYEFDIEKANDILDFAETLTIAEGEEEIPVNLEGFQVFILGCLNGWVTKGTGYRRFRTSYVQLGRQNGKSFLNGILGTYYGAFSGYKYGQLYCTATKSDQAKIVLNEMIKFINSDEDLSEFFKVREHDNTIIALNTNSIIRALGRDTKSIDGFRPLLGIVDEYHAHKNNQMYKLLEGGTRKMKQCLISVITTAGFELNCPCFKLYEYCKNILENVFTNDAQFVYIAEMDEEDDIWNSKNWIKANPLVCKDAEDLENLKRVGDSARDMGGDDLRDFLTKALNIWIQFTDDQYIKPKFWKECESERTLEDFRGQKCYAGLDLSSGGDLTSIALVFVYYVDGVKKYYIHSHSFIPKMKVEEHIKSDDAPYNLWIKDELLTVTETLGGIKTDYKYIIKYLNDLIEKYDLKIEQLGYDPHNADAFLSDLSELGFDCIEIYQTHKWLNDPTEDFELEVRAKNIEYNKENELLSWSALNAKTVSNPNGEIKIDKDRRNKRIDPIDAIIDAYKLAFKEERLVNVNESVDKYLDMMGWN
ncbi:terminase large subunit [Paeniclostridium sordellii]|uniref:terminase large subunit n=1 Tax=Paraclostridium sordellii TaxID=1505 RepID=UPI0005E8A847|nr:MULTISPECIES: terminase TerL endonuclease subunit [Paeniclostridium]MBW4863282.1 terminase large subunit [Paeniclostridium sp.]MBW4875036.1 terminase large subunit [Paeniclostridium sp.]MDU2686751.1 terminase TerL endonuclease subunit [Paeniclostridium sordellii]MDU4413050.1 terminase TerL endonuclease subunit [Paeniclostridium sordellii]MDU6248008.1 terminase TerL endonuclease subunit [Paeniclostridium sordellii]